MDFATAIAATTSALGFTKSAVSAAVNLSIDSQVKEKVNEALTQVGIAQDSWLNIQASLFSIQSDNFSLKEENRKLKEKQDRRALYSLVQTTGGGYVLQSINTEPSHSVCPTCVEKHSEYHVLQPAGDYLECKNCTSKYRVDTKQAAAMHAAMTQRNMRAKATSSFARDW